MKKWIPFFLIAFCAGVVIGGFLAKRALEHGRMRMPREFGRLYHRQTSPLSQLFMQTLDSSGRLYLRMIRGVDGSVRLLTSFCLSPAAEVSDFSTLRRILPGLSRMDRRDHSLLLSCSEFLPGGVFHAFKPDEVYRLDSFEMGYSRSGKRIFLLEPIPDEGAGVSASTCSLAGDDRTGREDSSETHWIPLSVLLVCIVLGFLLLMIQKRNEE